MHHAGERGIGPNSDLAIESAFHYPSSRNRLLRAGAKQHRESGLGFAGLENGRHVIPRFVNALKYVRPCFVQTFLLGGGRGNLGTVWPN